MISRMFKRLPLFLSEGMTLATKVLPQSVPSATSRLIQTLGRLKEIARSKGFSDSQMVLANIGDVAGVEELPVTKAARESVSSKIGRAHV